MFFVLSSLTNEYSESIVSNHNAQIVLTWNQLLKDFELETAATLKFIDFSSFPKKASGITIKVLITSFTFK